MRAPMERRLAAVLVADVAGYSRLVGADEEGTLSRLKAVRADLFDRKIAEHRGRIVHTAGDGLLVEFSSVVDALRCATEVQAGMSERNAAIHTDGRSTGESGSMLGTSSSRTATSLAKASILRPGSRHSPRPAGSVFRLVCRRTLPGKWTSPSKIWASSSCTTSAGQFGFIGSAPELLLPRRCRCPTSRRSQFWRSPI